MTQITAMVLRAVAAGHRYGLDVMDACDLKSGTAYPALRRLEDAGLLRSRWEDDEEARAAARPRRRIYELTDTGAAALPEAERKLTAALRLLEDLPAVSAEEA